MKMPSEFKSTEYYSNASKSMCRKWTVEEENYLLQRKKDGLTLDRIAKEMDRGVTSVRIKHKRLLKKNRQYNELHIKEKIKYNKRFLNDIKPDTILDLYAGNSTQYNNYDLISNDKNEDFNTSYHMDSFKCACKLYSEGYSFDLIDLDPFGSAFDCFDVCIKMAKKGLIITLGEMGHLRWKRLDFVSRYYNINKLEDFNVENIIEKIKEIGLRNKKELKVKYICNWNLISRVYFEIREINVVNNEDGWYENI